MSASGMRLTVLATGLSQALLNDKLPAFAFGPNVEEWLREVEKVIAESDERADDAERQLAAMREAYVETFGQVDPSAIDSQICETLRDVGGYSDLVRVLDKALNDVPTGKSLADLVAQVESQSAVRIVNMSDGMRINFRAPDGRRATLRIDVLLDNLTPAQCSQDVLNTMRDAVTVYPVAGELLPYEECAATGRDHGFGAHGPDGAYQCEFCGEAP